MGLERKRRSGETARKIGKMGIGSGLEDPRLHG